MLDSGGDDVLSPLAHALRGAEHGPVVGFRAAGGEERSSRAARMPKSYRALGLPQFSVSAFVMASTASEQGRVVAELSR